MKTVVVLSGGMDSATALGVAVHQYGKENVTTLTFNYGSKHNGREGLSARSLTKFYGVQPTYMKLDLDKILKSNLLCGGGDIPEGHYEDSNMKKTVVPFRNGILLSIAAGHAESIDAEILLIGSHFGDHAIYPDCREDFMTVFADAIEKGTWKGVRLQRPFGVMSKADIVRVGTKLGVPYGMTYSCYKGGLIHCGKCGTCVERVLAFKEAGVTDPTDYMDKEYAFTVKPPMSESDQGTHS